MAIEERDDRLQNERPRSTDDEVDDLKRRVAALESIIAGAGAMLRTIGEKAPVIILVAVAATEDAELVTFLALDAVTGARLGELVALRYSRIKGGVLSISHTISLGPSGPVEVPKRFRNKGRARTVALGPAITALLTSDDNRR